MDETTYEVIEGVIENLNVYDADVNYLANSEANSRAAGIFSVLQAATGSPGAVHSAQASNDAGDPVEAYSMTVGGKTIHGSFWKTTFQNGEHVKVVAFRQGSIFHAIAVADPENQVIWMQPHCERGVVEQRKYLVRNSLIFVVFVFAALAFLVKDEEMKLWLYLACGTSTSAGILFFTVGMSWGDLMTFAKRMSRVGAALQLESPDDINLARSTRKMIKTGKPELPMGVYYY